MTIIDDYLKKANQALQSGNAQQIDTIAKEIVSVFYSEIPNIAHYRGTRISSEQSNKHSANDLSKLVGILRVLQENKDKELYGQYGLESVTDSIRELENALYEQYSNEQLDELFHRVDYVYANKVPVYTQGLCGWSWSVEKTPCREQAMLRIQKLRNYRDEQMREMRIATSGGQNITMSQSQETTAIATSLAIAGLVEVYERIDEIPDEKLSEEEKNQFKVLLTNLEQTVTKNKKDKYNIAKKALGFIADKGLDAFIAAAPYLWNLLQR